MFCYFVFVGGAYKLTIAGSNLPQHDNLMDTGDRASVKIISSSATSCRTAALAENVIGLTCDKTDKNLCWETTKHHSNSSHATWENLDILPGKYEEEYRVCFCAGMCSVHDHHWQDYPRCMGI